MKNIAKGLVKSTLDSFITLLNKTKVGRILCNRIAKAAMDQVVEVSHHNVHLRFATPNEICVWRAKTFAEKEPETLEWIDQMNEGSLVWDIGANVGLYSVYMALKKKCVVFAFEPSVFNLELLARNIFLNKLSANINIVPLALSDKLGTGNMRMTTIEWGGALSTFKEDFGWDGKKINEVFEFVTMGLSMDEAMALLNIPQPEYIKLDVDGLEHFILKGGINVLKNVKEILLEINDDFIEQADDCRKLLVDSGFRLKEKLHSEMITNNTHGFQNSFNQIWVR